MIRQAADETDILSKQANIPASTICFCCAMRLLVNAAEQAEPVTVQATGGGCEVLLAGTRRFHYDFH